MPAVPKPAVPLPGAPHPAAPKSKVAAPPPASPKHPENRHAGAPKPRPKLAPLVHPKGPSTSGGQPLAPHIKEAIQNSLLVDLGAVRLHASTAAERKAQSLSARAFTFGNDIFLGKGEHPTDLTLISHEAAHVIQQQSAPAVQTWSPDRSDRYEREADQAAAAVQRSEPFAVRERVDAPRVQRLGISDALDYFADKANNIPGYRMFTIVLGVNPINMQPVERSAANVLRAVVEFIPGGGLITQALDKYGVFDKVGNWVQEQLDTLAMTGSSIKKALMDFLDSLSWSDIFHLGDVWDRATRIFTEPIDRIKNFVKGFVEGIWKFLRDAILKPIAKLAEGTAGWPLLTAVLGRNPITGEAVPRTPETLIGGFMKLIHQDEIWNNLKKSNAVSRAWAWFQGVLSGLLGFVSQIPDLFIQALKSLEWFDVINLPQGFMKLVGVFGKFLGNFTSWAGGKIWDLLQIIFEVVAPAAMPYLKKVGVAFKGILQNPMGFVRNLVAGAKLGFVNFGSHFLKHLQAGLIDWLTGSLPGVYIPKALSLVEFGKFALSVLGISWAQIRGKIVKVLGPNGETIMKGLETGFDVVVALVKGGPAAAWELIKEKLTDLKDTVIQGITSFVIDTIVQKAIPKLISMFIPGAGFISAIVSIYDTIKTFLEKLSKIMAAVKAFLDSIVAIAAGQIEGAANKVESTLAGLLSLAISFLAGFLGLGSIASKVLAVIEKVRAMVDKGIDTAIAWIVGKAKALFAKLFGKKDEKDKRTEEEKTRAKLAAIAEAEKLIPQEGLDEQEVRGKLGPIKERYKLLTLNLVIDSKQEQTETVHFTASASEEEIGKPKQVKTAAAGPVTPVAVGSWINNLKAGANSYEQVTSSVSTKRRTAAGVETPVNFLTAAPNGGTNTLLYKDEGVTWARSNFSHGSKHAVPVGNGKFVLRVSERGSEFIRPTFYADTSSSRNAVVRAKLPSLLNPSNQKEFLSEGDPSAEFAKGYKKDASTGKALVPVSDASPDHFPPIAQHWTGGGGNNASQAMRQNWNNNTGTYQIMSLQLNLSLSSRGARFTEEVGINFKGPGE
ncbi:MAG: DUF4157 domain-containing protein [Candidatus Korobacteraceae bacterium]